MDIKTYMDSSQHKAACLLGDFIEKNDKTDHPHYGCRWEVRNNSVFHVCYEQNKEWEVKC